LRATVELTRIAAVKLEREDESVRRRRDAILQAVDEQLSSPQTPEVRAHFQRLLALGYDDDEARIMIAGRLIIFITNALNGLPYTHQDYVRELERLPQSANEWPE
jgi:hypothetical protein